MGARTEAELAGAYHRTLLVLFRLLFLAYAEDRGLLPFGRNQVYDRHAVKTLAREFAANPDAGFDPNATSLWDDMLTVWKAIDEGNTSWDVPAYNGGLFSRDPGTNPVGAALAGMHLTDAEFGPALRALLVDSSDDETYKGPVDFPGLPMSSLDHNLVVGNSLTGIATIDEVLDVLEPRRLPDQESLFAAQIRETLNHARERLILAARMSEATKAQVQEAAKAHAEALKDAADAKALMDAAVAIRLGLAPLAPAPEIAIRNGRSDAVQKELAKLKAVHLPYLFPEIFLRANPGFDCLLGNPPWEKVKVEEHQWWGLRFPGLRSMTQKDKNAAIARYRKERPDLVAEYTDEVERTNETKTAISTGDFPGMGADGAPFPLLPHADSLTVFLRLRANPRLDEAGGDWEFTPVAELHTTKNKAMFDFDLAHPHLAPYLLRKRGDARAEAFMLGVLSSIPLDWYARRYVEVHLTAGYLRSFPIPRPSPEDPAYRRVVEIAGRLAAVDGRYADWAAQVGVPVGSVTTRGEKDELIAELDAVASFSTASNGPTWSTSSPPSTVAGTTRVG